MCIRDRVLAVGGSLFTVGIVALPDQAGAPPLHAELHQRLGPIERVWQESDGDLLLKPLGVPTIWSLECDTDFGTLIWSSVIERRNASEYKQACTPFPRI